MILSYVILCTWSYCFATMGGKLNHYAGTNWLAYFKHLSKARKQGLRSWGKNIEKNTTQSNNSRKNLPYLDGGTGPPTLIASEGRGDLESILQILCFLIHFGPLNWCSNLSPRTSRENLIYVHMYIERWKGNPMVVNELSEFLHKYLKTGGNSSTSNLA